MSEFEEDDKATFIPTPGESDVEDQGAAFVAPQQIGNYRILGTLGQGGMGLVYEAQQEQPVRRKVALKIIRKGMDTQEVVRRFESERQSLAMMDHPYIAHVYDGGATEEGRPYFVMERVVGEPITDYCDKHRLDTRQRLELMINVCDGVQHAHQKGIIHRDIKPSNVLVHEQNGKHLPKIIDFGIAKATDRAEVGGGMTEVGQMIGTLEYLSPEQALGTSDIDTRADVYLLGIMLYELLTGQLPFDTDALREDGLIEFRRKILEDEPSRPSTRVTSGGTDLTAQAKKHLTDPRSFTRLLRGDLDWITMRALEKDRTRRYASTSELAADIGRYLKNEPVLASPPSKVYRVKKFVRRHRVGVSFSVLIGALLIGFAATMTIQRVQIARARDAVQLERDRVTKEAATSQEVSGFLESLFIVSDPTENLGNTITAREILDRGADRIDTELSGQPAVQGRLMRTMGSVYGSLGLVRQSRALLERSLELRLQTADEEPLEIAKSMVSLATLVSNNFGEFDRARELQEQALEIRIRELGEEHVEVAATKNNLAVSLLFMGEYDRAEALWEQVFETLGRVAGPEHPDALTALNNRAALLKRKGDLATARPLYEQVLEIRRRQLGPIHAKLAVTLTNLAGLLEEQHEYAEALTHYEEAHQMREQIFGDEHRLVAESLMPMARINFRLGYPEDAESFHARAVEVHRQTGGFNNPFVLLAESRFHALIGDMDEAISDLRQAVERGYSDVDKLLSLDDFERLRDDPRFASIVAALRPPTEGE